MASGEICRNKEQPEEKVGSNNQTAEYQGLGRRALPTMVRLLVLMIPAPSSWGQGRPADLKTKSLEEPWIRTASQKSQTSLEVCFDRSSRGDTSFGIS
jgi:hypothetical protein